MDEQPTGRHEVLEVEYLDAEPIENAQLSPTPDQQPYVRTYYSGGGCTPCCGPFGCLACVFMLGYVFYEFEFVRAVALAAVIFLIVSIMAGSVSRRMR